MSVHCEQVWLDLLLPHQVDQLGDGDLSDGLLHAAQGLQRGAEAAGQVVPRDGDEVVFAPVQMEHQDVLDGVLSGVQQRDRVFTDVHLQVDLQGLVCSGRCFIERLKNV